MKKSPVKFYFFSLLFNLAVFLLLVILGDALHFDLMCVLLFYVSHLVIFCTYLILRKLK
jgi:hypothetical protein